MGILIEGLLISVIISIIMLQIAELRLCYSDRLYISISLVIFKLTIPINAKNKNKRDGIKINGKLRFISSTVNAVIDSLQYARVEVRSLYLPKAISDGGGAIFASILIPSFLTYLSSITDLSIDNQVSENKLDVLIYIPLYRVFIFLTKLLYYYLRGLLGGKNNARKSNG